MLRDYVLEVICEICDEEHFIAVDRNDYIRWRQGEPIQKAFPYLSTNQRELLITLICGKCLTEME